MKLGYSPLTGTIYAGTTRKNKNDQEIWAKKEDVTNLAIRAVFELMKDKCGSEPVDYLEITYPGTEGCLVFNMSKKSKTEKSVTNQCMNCIYREIGDESIGIQDDCMNENNLSEDGELLDTANDYLTGEDVCPFRVDKKKG